MLGTVPVDRKRLHGHFNYSCDMLRRLEIIPVAGQPCFWQRGSCSTDANEDQEVLPPWRTW